MSTTSTLDRSDHADRDGRLDPGPGGGSAGDGTLPPADPVTLHRRRGALALVGIGAAATAAGYLWRTVDVGSGPVGYFVAAALLLIAALHLAAWWDSRVPLLVADETGIRLRAGRAWTGLRWDEVDTVRLAPSRLPRRDARLDVGASGGAAPLLPLALVDPADVRALPQALRGLAPAPVQVVVAAPGAGAAAPAKAADVPPVDSADDPVVEPVDEAPEHTAPAVPAGHRGARLRRWVAAALSRTTPGTPAADGQVDEAPANAPGEPAGTAGEPQPGTPRQVRVARADVVVEGSAGSVSAVRGDADPAREPVPGAEEPGRVPLVIEQVDEPASTADAVIGARLVQARRRLRLSVDDLADRTRIRPHVIDAIEVDDFSACGGDVYARGHLRVLARVLGIDADGLVAEFDSRYSAGPVPARKVLEAELAGPGRSMRTTSGGPRWSVLVGVVIVLVLLWALARLLVPDAGGAGDRGFRSAPPGISTGPTLSLPLSAG